MKTPCAIGFGSATFGREIDAAASHALLDHALRRGVKHYDTAEAYSAGASETILGDWLSSRRPAGVEVATKLIPPYTAERMQSAFEAGLSRLRRDRVDILYLHRWDAAIDDAALRALDGFVRSGRCAALGISNIAPPQFDALLRRQSALGVTPFSVLQCNQNYAVSEMTPEMRAITRGHGIRVITFSPLGAGFLTGKHRAGVVPGSRFAIVPGHQAIYFQPEARARLDRLHSIAERSGHRPEHLALAWALRQPDVSVVLVGGRAASHLDQAFDARALAGSPVVEELLRG